MTRVITILILMVFFASCSSPQEKEQGKYKLVGGPCEGCEAVFEYENKELFAVDTLPDFNDEGPKLKVTGTIYQPDGITPAKGVILYIYHTDQNGIYPKKGNETGWGRRHGYLRGWIKTDSEGKYTFYTLRPGVYPSRNAPAHIHATILEPDGKYYWIVDFLFDDDLLISESDRFRESPRGGNNGILYLQQDGNLWISERDIILGKNVPGYN